MCIYLSMHYEKIYDIIIFLYILSILSSHLVNYSSHFENQINICSIMFYTIVNLQLLFLLSIHIHIIYHIVIIFTIFWYFSVFIISKSGIYLEGREQCDRLQSIMENNGTTEYLSVLSRQQWH